MESWQREEQTIALLREFERNIIMISLAITERGELRRGAGNVAQFASGQRASPVLS